MKRSEIVDKVYNYLNEQYDSFHEVKHKHIANQLVELIEGCGMLPPVINPDKEHPNTKYIYRWEKEDE